MISKNKQIISISLMICILLMCFSVTSYAEPNDNGMNFDCRSVILIEAETGTVLFEQNADEALPPASVTKVMTLLIVMEAIAQNKLSLSDTVTASAHACSMGGSQIYLEEGEQMSVEDMLKSVVIASANDAAVALAEHIAGTEEAFVALMNKRAEELGMKNTHFENTNGLDDSVENHVTSARDIAIMSAELISHKKILEYSSIWMDTIRNGEFGLTNTNRLVRFYKGANGLKTGSTSKAKFCISATAERKGMTLICVVMAAPTRDIRNATATALFDWGFANFDIYNAPEIDIQPVKVVGGVKNSCLVEQGTFKTVVDKANISKIKHTVQLPQNISAPIKKGDKIGSVEYFLENKLIGTSDIFASENIDKISFWYLFFNILSKISLM